MLEDLLNQWWNPLVGPRIFFLDFFYWRCSWGQVKDLLVPSASPVSMHVCIRGVCVFFSLRYPSVHSLPPSAPRSFYLWTTSSRLHCPISGWVPPTRGTGGRSEGRRRGCRVFIFVTAVPSALLRFWPRLVSSELSQTAHFHGSSSHSFLPLPSDFQVVIVSQLLLDSGCCTCLSTVPVWNYLWLNPLECVLFPAGNADWYSVCSSLM